MMMMSWSFLVLVDRYRLASKQRECSRESCRGTEQEKVREREWAAVSLGVKGQNDGRSVGQLCRLVELLSYLYLN